MSRPEQTVLPPLQLPMLGGAGSTNRSQQSLQQSAQGGSGSRPLVGGESRPQRHAPNSMHGSVARVLPPLHEAVNNGPNAVDNSIASTSARTRTTHPQAIYGARPDGGLSAQQPQQHNLLSPSDSVSPPKTWAAQSAPLLHHHHAQPPSGAPLSIPQLITELMTQNQMLECRLTESVSNGSSAVQVAPPPKLCELCDDGSTPDSASQRARAVYYCEDCRRMGLPSEFCEPCWADEHRSRRTREHRRNPIPLVTTTLVATPSSTEDGSTASRANVIDARAVLSLQQQVLQLLMHVMPRSLRDCNTQTDAASSAAPPVAAAVSTSPTASGAAAQHVARPLFAPPLHLIMLQMKLLDAEEQAQRQAVVARANAELLTAVLQHRFLFVTVTEVFEVPPIPEEADDDGASNDGGLKEMDSPPPVAMTSGQRHQGAAPPAPPNGRPPFSPNRGDPRSTAAKQPPVAPVAVANVTNLVEVVHGEKHLPGQRHMLLVRFTSGEEDWVPAEAVQHHAEVRRYMQRKGTPDSAAQRPVYHAPTAAAAAVAPTAGDAGSPTRRTFGRELSPVGVFELDSGAAGPYESALGDTERQELAAQLAALQRIGTAGSVGLASRGSLLGGPGDEFAVPQRLVNDDDDGGAGPGSSDEDDEVAAQAGQEVPPATSSQRNTPRRPGPVTFREDVRGGEPLSGRTDGSRAQTASSGTRRHSSPDQQQIPPPPPQQQQRVQTQGAMPPLTPPQQSIQQQQQQPFTPPPQGNPTRPQPSASAAAPNGAADASERGPYVTYRRAQQMPRATTNTTTAGDAAPPATSSADAEAAAASRQADEDVVRQYEQRVRLIEERQRQVRRMREEQEERLRALREKQQATDETNKRKIHAEYEEHEKTLAREQPEVQHPLYLTNDRHAALLLHKLHEEIAQAEKEKAAREEYRAKRASRPRSDNGGLDNGGGGGGGGGGGEAM